MVVYSVASYQYERLALINAMAFNVIGTVTKTLLLLYTHSDEFNELNKLVFINIKLLRRIFLQMAQRNPPKQMHKNRYRGIKPNNHTISLQCIHGICIRMHEPILACKLHLYILTKET